MSHRELLEYLRDYFRQRDVPVYLVGGYLRDLLLGRLTHDIDVAIPFQALPLISPLASRLEAPLVDLDRERGIFRLVVESDGQRLHLDVSTFPDDILADLARRDFTVNAMALSMEAFSNDQWQERVIDPLGGRQDLREGRIRAVSEAAFQEDSLRLLRAVRLASGLGFAIEEGTWQAVRRHAPLLPRAAPERLRDELLRILSQGDVARWLQVMDDLGLLIALVPELEEGRGISQPKEHHWDVLTHNIQAAGMVELLLERRGLPGEVLERVPWGEEMATRFAAMASDGFSRATLLRLTGLLHDVSKPATRTTDEGGRIRFIGHHTEGARRTEEILQRLRLSSRGVELVVTVVEHHLRPSQMSQGRAFPTPRAVYRFFRDLGDAAVDTLYFALADHLAARGPGLEFEEWRRHATIISHVLNTAWQVQPEGGLPKLVDGHALMEQFRLSPGSLVGRLLEAVREAQATGEISSREEALAVVEKILKREGALAGHRPAPED